MASVCPFFLDEQRRLLFCTVCRVLLGPNDVDHHLRVLVHRHIPKDARSAMIEKFKDADAFVLKDLKWETLRDFLANGPMPYLGNMETGFRCDSCGHAMSMESSIKKHSKGCQPNCSYTSCQVVRYYSNRYVAVPEEHMSPLLSDTTPPSWHASIADFEEALAVVRASPILVDPMEAGHHPIWDQRTGWLTWFAGRDMDLFTPFCSLRSLASDVFDVAQACQWIEQTFRRFYQEIFAIRANQGGNLLFRLVQSYSEDTYQDPFNSLAAGSEGNYIRTIKQVAICALRLACQSSEWLESSPTTLTVLQLETASTVIDLLRSSLAGQDDHKAVDSALLEFFRSLTEQNLGQDTRHSPVLFALAVLGWNGEQRRWYGPQSHTPMLSHLLYFIRVVGFTHVLRTSDSKSRILNMTQYRREHLSGGRASLLDELHNQRNLGWKVSSDTYGRPTVIWEDNNDAIVVCGDRVEIPKLREFLADLISQAQLVLVQELLLGENADLLGINVSTLRENISWANARENFVDLNRDLQGGAGRIAARVAKASDATHASNFVNVHLASPADRARLLKQYQESIERFLRLLALIHLTCGGAPPRGTEITRLTWCNASVRCRSWYIVDGLLCAVYDYNKTESNAGQAKVIARFYPTSVAQMVVAFLSEVRPFELYLAHQAQLDLKELLCPLVWQVDHLPLDSERISHSLGRESSTYMDVKLNLHSWRHLHIALMRALTELENAPPDRTMAQCLAFQAGHSLDLEEHHYALTADDLVGLSTHTLSAFKAASLRWHRFMNLDGRGGEPVSRRSPSATLTNKAIASLQSQIERLTSVVLDLSQRLEGGFTGPADVLQHDHPRKRSRPMVPDTPPRSACMPSPADVKTKFQQMYGPDFAYRHRQEEAITAMLASSSPRSIFVSLPTGGGKTLLIEASAHASPGRTTVVVVPTISLKDDLLSRLNKAGVRAAAFSGGDCTTFAQRSVLVVVMESTRLSSFSQLLHQMSSRDALARTFWDEAHLIALEGISHEEGRVPFREWVSAIRDWPTREQHIFLSATMPTDIQNMIQTAANIHPGETMTIRTPYHVPQLRFEVKLARDNSGVSDLQECVLRPDGTLLKTIIFVRSKDDGDRLSSEFEWPFYHGGISKLPAGQAILATLQSAEPSVIIATTALAHGIDCVVDQVIIYGHPFDLATAIQQAGRAGRHRIGRCIFLQLNPILGQLPTREKIERGWLPILALYTTTVCRRQPLSLYLDGTWQRVCQKDDGDVGCDHCAPHWEWPTTPREPSLSAIFDCTMAGDSDVSNTSSSTVVAETILPSSRPSPPLPIERRIRSPRTPNRWLSSVRSSPSSVNPSFTPGSSRPPRPVCSLRSPPVFHRSNFPPSSSPQQISSLPGLPWYSSPQTSNPVGPTERHALLRTLDCVENTFRTSCQICWLENVTNPDGHYLQSCPRNSVYDDVQSMEKKRASSLSKISTEEKIRGYSPSGKRLHYKCYLPLQQLHPSQDCNMRDHCERSGMVWTVVEWARRQPAYTNCFQSHGVDPSQAEPGFTTALLVWQGPERLDLLIWSVLRTIWEQRISQDQVSV